MEIAKVVAAIGGELDEMCLSGPRPASKTQDGMAAVRDDGYASSGNEAMQI